MGGQLATWPNILNKKKNFLSLFPLQLGTWQELVACLAGPQCYKQEVESLHHVNCYPSKKEK